MHIKLLIMDVRFHWYFFATPPFLFMSIKFPQFLLAKFIWKARGLLKVLVFTDSLVLHNLNPNDIL